MHKGRGARVLPANVNYGCLRCPAPHLFYSMISGFTSHLHLQQRGSYKMSNLIGGSELARILNTTRQSVNKAANSGRITVTCVGDKGRLFDRDQAVAEWEATKGAAELQNRASHMPPGMKGGRPTKGQNDQDDVATEGLTDQERYFKAKAVNEEIRAKQRALELKLREGELIEKKQAFQDGVDLGAVLLGALQAWPSRLAPEFVSMKDATEHDFYMRLSKECNELIVSIRTLLNLE